MPSWCTWYAIHTVVAVVVAVVVAAAVVVAVVVIVVLTLTHGHNLVCDDRTGFSSSRLEITLQ